MKRDTDLCTCFHLRLEHVADGLCRVCPCPKWFPTPQLRESLKELKKRLDNPEKKE